ncbi:BTAD domain-containing putative transcriptional regulator, partial [Nocardioides sp.]|uniref:BTAD domain-containing putative transcriptional regulator n=1 Tax=Nocardioides sp. TaxID=35761 RepID=UPI001A354E37
MQAGGFAVLGPLALVPVTGGSGSAGGPKQRALLSLLLLHRGSPLSADRLVDTLWDGRAPDGADVTLRSHVSHLRRRLAEAVPACRVETGPLGYTLLLGAAGVDADVFEDLLGQGQEAFGLGRPDRAAELLRQALGLWRGPPWHGLEHVDVAAADAVRLEELRLAAHEVLLAAELDRGRHREVVAEAESLHGAHPFRERFAGQLMLALYRSGRQAEALEVYAATRERLAEELGLDPGPELQTLYQAVLRQDPALAAQAAVAPAARTTRPREVTDGVLAALSAAPLDGRAAQCELLAGTWRSVVGTGAPRLVLVSGEAGIGKSRLVAELVHAAVEDGATVLVGRCDGTDAAYHPIADALRSSRAAQAVLT